MSSSFKPLQNPNSRLGEDAVLPKRIKYKKFART
jgi:hypothetical protein